MNTVYVVQENPKVDIISATKYGELIPLANPTEQLHLNPSRIISQFKRKLTKFSDNDYLLLLGDPALIGVAVTVASDVNNGKVSVLKWDRIEKMYYPVKLSFRGGIGDYQ